MEDAAGKEPSGGSPPPRVWAWPWAVAVVMVYLVAVPWIASQIIVGYLVDQDWEGTLPALGTTALRRFSIAAHMALGAICMLVGPFQFIGSLRRARPSVHRWMGRLFFVTTITSAITGFIFICAKGKLVGGWNMTVSFAVAGFAFGTFAAISWYFAAQEQYTRHRNWAIRSFAQIVSPFLYRYWYIAAAILGYDTVSSYDNGEGEDCSGEEEVCKRYFRPFDAIHVWTYWVFSLVVAEVVVFCLGRVGLTVSPPAPELPLDASLSPMAEEGEMGRIAKATIESAGTDPSPSALTSASGADAQAAAKFMNYFAVSFAVACVVITVGTFVGELNWIN
uniref:Uncharacterized protein n=1 Tax=Rhizochromulina marina TaxID=1034831 RepID=A0A7S2SVV9_9STRA